MASSEYRLCWYFCGTLPLETTSLVHQQCSRYLQAQALTCIRTLFGLNLCLHAGTIPASWGSVNAFPSLAALTLYDVPLTGSLPAKWGSHGSLPAMQGLRLGTGRRDFSCLSGTLPADWASAAAFQNLTKLEIGGCMTGVSLATLCTALQLQTTAVPCISLLVHVVSQPACPPAVHALHLASY